MQDTPPPYVEVEVKLPVPSAAFARKLLRAAGFKLRHRRAFESNVLYDTPRGDLRRSARLLRIRACRNKHCVTFKGPPTTDRYKCREELEVSIGHTGVFEQLLQRLGFQPAFRYEKFRTDFFRGPESGLVSLDETPIGVYLELEGEPVWIDATARRLGFGPDDYVTSGYPMLYLEHCRRAGGDPAAMVFPDG